MNRKKFFVHIFIISLLPAFICEAGGVGLKLYGPCLPTESSCLNFIKDDGTTFFASPTDHINLTIKDAKLSESDQGFNIILDAAAAKNFEVFTGSHVGQMIGLVYNDKLLSAPKVMTAISGGEFMISGAFTENLAEKNRALCKEIFPACKDYEAPALLQRLFDGVIK